MMAVTSSAGVMSKAKLSALVPAGAAGTVISSSERCSTGMSRPVGVARSMVDSGTATRVGFVQRAWLSRPRRMAGRIRRLALACVVMVT